MSQGYSRSWRHVVLAVPVCSAMRSMSVSMIEVFLSVGLWLSLDGDPFFAVSLSGFQQESSASQWLAKRSRDELEEVVERSCGRRWGDWSSLTGRLPREWRCEGRKVTFQLASGRERISGETDGMARETLALHRESEECSVNGVGVGKGAPVSRLPQS